SQQHAENVRMQPVRDDTMPASQDANAALCSQLRQQVVSVSQQRPGIADGARFDQRTHAALHYSLWQILLQPVIDFDTQAPPSIRIDIGADIGLLVAAAKVDDIDIGGIDCNRPKEEGTVGAQ